MKSVLIRKNILKNLRYLRRYAKNFKNSKGETAAWICDNFYTAEQSGKSAADFFKTATISVFVWRPSVALS